MKSHLKKKPSTTPPHPYKIRFGQSLVSLVKGGRRRGYFPSSRFCKIIESIRNEVYIIKSCYQRNEFTKFYLNFYIKFKIKIRVV